jgi:lipase
VLHVRAWGPRDVPAVVCLHGVGRTGELFGPLAEAIPKRVLAIDLRGHGCSTWEPPWRIETHVEDVLEAIGELRPQAWVGHSFGGRLIVELAARDPGLVERAVLLDPAIRMRPDISLAEAESHRLREDLTYSQSAAVAMLGELAGPHARVEALTMPTLLVIPREGAVVGLRQRAYAERACPQLTVATVGGDHHVLETAFEETAAVVRAFLA